MEEIAEVLLTNFRISILHFKSTKNEKKEI